MCNGGMIIILLSVFKAKHHCEWPPSSRVVSKTSFIETSCLIYFFSILHFILLVKEEKKKKGKKPSKLYSYLFTLSSTFSSLKLVHYKFSKLLLSHYEMLRHLLSVGEFTNVCIV